MTSDLTGSDDDDDDEANHAYKQTIPFLIFLLSINMFLFKYLNLIMMLVDRVNRTVPKLCKLKFAIILYISLVLSFRDDFLFPENAS